MHQVDTLDLIKKQAMQESIDNANKMAASLGKDAPITCVFPAAVGLLEANIRKIASTQSNAALQIDASEALEVLRRLTKTKLFTVIIAGELERITRKMRESN